MAFCQNCGAPLAEGQAFCTSCGSKNNQDPSNVNSSASNNGYGQNAQSGNYNANPGYGAPGYGAPGYGAPGYGAPGYGAPGYGNPGYGAATRSGASAGYPPTNAAAPVSFLQKNIATCIILSIVTCGIYGIIWMIDMVDNLNEASATPNAQPGSTVFLLSLVTCGIYALIWVYRAGEMMNNAKVSRGIPADPNSSLIYLLLSLFGLGIVAYAMIQSDLNNIAAMYGAPPA